MPLGIRIFEYMYCIIFTPELILKIVAKGTSFFTPISYWNYLDVVIVFLTTHGTEGLLALKPSANEQATGVSADALRDFLKPAQNDQQIIILQACYSGSLIKGLKHPNRIIMTAAAADRTSFGCNPDSNNTWFTKAMIAALPTATNWSEVFEGTKSKVLAYESQQGIKISAQSNPQYYVGRNMKRVWKQKF
jgi:hypothetical protein